MQESRTYTLIGQSTITTSGTETGFVRLPRPATAATFLASVISASGTIKVVIQRGISFGVAGDTSGLPVTKNSTDTDIEWFDYASFTSTTTAGKRVLPLVYTSTTNDSRVTTDGSIASNSQMNGSIGTLFRGAYQVSGASPTFSIKVVGEFEF